jgi:hypothetical protein
MDRNFCQTVTFRSEHPDELVALAREWDTFQADQDVMGYIGVAFSQTETTRVDS